MPPKIILQMDLIEDYEDSIDRHYANFQDYHRLEPLEHIANDKIIPSKISFQYIQFNKAH